MENIILSPSKYIQGANSLSNIAKYAKKMLLLLLITLL